MNVLIADDSSTIRSILNRCLVKEFGCKVTEAVDGIEVLKALDVEPFSLVVLDIHMPVMDGLEALEILRNSVHNAVPVVMLTSDRDQDLFNRAVFLGVADYLTKPLKPETMVERFGKVLGSAGATESESEPTGDGGLAVETDFTVLVAEGDPDHRHFLLDYFGSRCQVLEAATGAAALEQCLRTTPHMVLAGGDLGTVDAPTLARKIRGNSALADTRVVATVSRSQVAMTRSVGVYDAVIARSFVTEVFQDQFERLTMRPDPLTTTLEHVHPRIREGLVTAIEHVFGMALATEVTALDSASPPEADDEVLTAALELALPHEALTLAFELLVRANEASALAARMLDQPAVEVTEADRDSALAEICNMIVGRLHNTLAERGVAGQIGLPTTEVRAPKPPPSDSDLQTTIHFRCNDGQPELWLHVVAEHDKATTDQKQAA
jgi:two-component system chemotaxis response regulator CheY